MMGSEREEFEYPRPNLVVSRHGFSVEVKMPTAIIYEESGRRMTLFAEALATTEPKIVIRRTDIKQWDESPRSADLSDRDRDQIVDNIRRAFQFRNWILLVE